MTQPTREEALAHYGIPGMKWGVRTAKRNMAVNAKAIKLTGKAVIGTGKLAGKTAVGEAKLAGKTAAGVTKLSVKSATVMPRTTYKVGKKVTQMILEEAGLTTMAEVKAAYGARNARRVGAAKELGAKVKNLELVSGKRNFSGQGGF